MSHKLKTTIMKKVLTIVGIALAGILVYEFVPAVKNFVGKLISKVKG